MKLLAVALSALAVAASHGAVWRALTTNGVTVHYPSSWYATSQPLTAVTSPQQVIAVASYRFKPNIARADGCEPKEPLDSLPATGAFIYGWDAGQVTGKFNARPKHFTFTRPAHGECLGRGAGYTFTFRDNGSVFTVDVALGKHASTATRATVLRILDRLTTRS